MKAKRVKESRAERKQVAWREMEELLARVHARTQKFSDDEIEADIAAAREEVREHIAYDGVKRDEPKPKTRFLKESGFSFSYRQPIRKRRILD